MPVKLIQVAVLLGASLSSGCAVQAPVRSTAPPPRHPQAARIVPAPSAPTATLSNVHHLKIFADRAPEFAYIRPSHFQRYGVLSDGSHDILDERWSYRRGEEFFIAFMFPDQLYGMSGSLRITRGNKVLGEAPIETIRDGSDMLGMVVNAKGEEGIYTVEWWLGRNGNQKLAAIQLYRVQG